MKQRSLSMQNPVLSRLSSVLAAGIILFATACSKPVESVVDLTIDPTLGQTVFATPEIAAQAFVRALKDRDRPSLEKILGSDYRQVLSLEDVDQEDIDDFIAAWESAHTLLAEGEQQRILEVGDGWTLPIPISADATGWHFDAEAGAERMRIRRIGRNELNVMQAVLAYYDAQIEYAEQDRNGSGGLEYAQAFISMPGGHDGLYWEAEEGEEQSPLGLSFADLTPEAAYHGYHYRILKSQGENATGGRYDYMIGERMVAGFALIAWPAEYGNSGVMSFIVSHDGLLYEQDLGPDSDLMAGKIQGFDPAPGWVTVQEVHGPQASL